MTGVPAGYRLLPHTADVRLLAWGPTREACLDQAVRALAAVFVELPGGVPASPPGGVPACPPAGVPGCRPGGVPCPPAGVPTRVPVELPPGPDAELLVGVLEEALFLVDVRGLVARAAELHPDGEGGLRGTLDAVALADVVPVGSVPKAIARSGLRFGEDDDGAWRCVVTVDV